MKKILNIVGGGLAGSEAAWQAAEAGIKVRLYEMRDGARLTEAHKTDGLAELVCSNSFRSDDHETSAIGLLHEEMRRCGSLIMKCADKTKVPAGGALAMDRDEFSREVTKAIYGHKNIEVVREEVTGLPLLSLSRLRGRAREGEPFSLTNSPHQKSKELEIPKISCLPPQAGGGTMDGDDELVEQWIIATGPLTSMSLAKNILEATGEEYLAFFDAIAPVVFKESINFDIAWYQSRYDKEGPAGTGKDYINCPMTKEQYFAFVESLINGDKTEFKEWEKNTPYFEGCLPIEVMAERGPETLRYGPMKPVGLTPPNGIKPYAVVQLRQDNRLGTLYNMVGFQTKLKYGAQTDIFRQIPGLENAEFARLGGIHRNTFINSPRLLDETLALKKSPNIRFAGQVTGVEGYVESAACGLLAGRFALNDILGYTNILPPMETALGALLNHVTRGHLEVLGVGCRVSGEEKSETQNPKPETHTFSFQPMNINFGLFPELEQKTGKKDRKKAYCERALKSLNTWLNPEKIAA